MDYDIMHSRVNCLLCVTLCVCFLRTPVRDKKKIAPFASKRSEQFLVSSDVISVQRAQHDTLLLDNTLPLSIQNHRVII